MTTNGAGAESRIDQAIELIAGEYDDTLTRQRELAREVAQVKAVQVRLKASLRPLAPNHPLLKTKGSSGGKTSQVVRPDKLAAVWAWVHEQGEARFSQAEATTALEGSASPDTVRRSLSLLHGAEAIRRTGMKAGPSGHESEAFGLLDIKAGERALEQNAASYKPGRKAAK